MTWRRSLRDMTETISGMPPDIIDAGSSQRVPWEVPEIAAVAVLIAIGALILGGLATGIVTATSAETPYSGLSQATWTAVTLGAAWASPILAIVVLGVMGLCWWQTDTWEDQVLDGVPFAVGHLRRAQHIATWAVAGLLISVAAAVADLVAVVGFYLPDHAPQLLAARVIPVAASGIAVLVIAGAGLVIFRNLRRPRD